MHHPTVEAVALTLVDVPFTLATVILLSISSLVFKYPLLNFCVFILLEFFLTLSQTFCPDFSTYFLFILVVALSMKALFCSLAAAFKNAAPGSGSSWGVDSRIVSVHGLPNSQTFHDWLCYPKLDWNLKLAEMLIRSSKSPYLSKIGKPNILECHLLISENANIRLAFTWSCKSHCTRDA